ncbi:MAG: response regulator [Archangium sp.]
MGRILLVEDDALVGRSVSRLIGKRHDVTVVHTVDQALELLHMEDFDLIVSDIVMPGKSGMDLHVALTQNGKADKMVFLTGAILARGVKEFLDRVPNRFLEKPSTREALMELIDTELARLATR